MVVGVKSEDKERAARGISAGGREVAEMGEKLGGLVDTKLPLIAGVIPALADGQRSRVADAKHKSDEADQEVESELQKLRVDQRPIYKDILIKRAVLEAKKVALNELVSDEASPKESIEKEAAAIQKLEKEIDAKKAQLPESDWFRLVEADDKAREAKERYTAENDALEKLKAAKEKFADLKANQFDTAFDEAPGNAQKNEIKPLAEKFGKGKYADTDEYLKMLGQEEKKLDSDAKKLWAEGSELWLLDQLFHELQQYESKSGRDSALYALGQHFGLKSKTGQRYTVMDVLSQIDFSEIRKGIALYEEKVIARNAIREAIEMSKEGADNAYLKLKELAEGDADELKAYGIANSVILRTPEVLLKEAREEAKGKLEALIGKRVDEVIEEFNEQKAQPSTKERKHLNGMFQQVYAEVAYALPQSFANLSDSDRKMLVVQKKKLDEAMDKFCKRYDIKQVKKTITKEHIDMMIDHFQDMVNWGESELIERSMKTYWDVVSELAGALGLGAREAEETLNDWVKRHLLLAMAFRNAGLQTARAPPSEGTEVTVMAT